MLFELHTHNEIYIRISYVNERNISIFKNITGRTYINTHITNSDMRDTNVNAACQYITGTITLDISDQRLIISVIIRKCNQCQLWQLHYELHIN